MVVLSTFFIQIKAQLSDVKLGDVLVVNGVKGIVFQIDEDGCHGTMMSVKAFRSKQNAYSVKSSYLKGLKMSSRTDGLKNTYEVFEKSYSERIPIKNYPVFQWCWSLGQGWYIPSVEQLEIFVNYWLGNTVETDWEEDDVVADDIPHTQKVNQILLDAGGIPFLNGVYTSTMDENGKVSVYNYNKQKKFWQFKQVNPMKMDELSVGRAFYDF